MITNRINNFTANTMYYSLIFHPAFNIEGDVADYRLDFAPEQEKLTDLQHHLEVKKKQRLSSRTPVCH